MIDLDIFRRIGSLQENSMYKKLSAILLLTVSAIGSTFTASATNANSVPATITKPALGLAASDLMPFNEQALKETLFAKIGLEVKRITPTPMLGLVEVITNQGLFYSSYDGKFLIKGNLYSLGAEVSNLTEDGLAKVRVEGVARFENDAIVYPAKNEKYIVDIFTDITCGYCRKLHEQMSDYNDKGITVRYLAYPRSGVKDRSGNFTQGFKDLRSVWCHENPQEALTKAKSGSGVAQRICDKPIEQEFEFGRQVGVTGTPAIILANGMMLPGYKEPDALLSILESL
jgi:thiol:disulfide interchange protein DsbC